MALARVKTWISEVLTASDLNAEFNNILNYLNGSGVTLISPTVTGTLAGASATWSGTLGVTGAATLSSTLGVTGTSTLAAAKTASGVTASTATATPVTIYTPTGAASGSFLVTANVGGSAGFASWAIVYYDANGGLVSRLGGNNAANGTITATATAIQTTQTSGVNQVMEYAVFRMGA